MRITWWTVTSFGVYRLYFGEAARWADVRFEGAHVRYLGGNAGSDAEREEMRRAAYAEIVMEVKASCRA